MNTFLPFPDIFRSAKSLDNKRLGKQRVEGLQLLGGLLDLSVNWTPYGCTVTSRDPNKKGWQNHPCTLMWEDTINALGIYTLIICREWNNRGYQDTVADQIKAMIPNISIDWTVKLPRWFGNEEFHRSHRSNLIRKDYGHYAIGQGWTDPPDLPYIWPRP